MQRGDDSALYNNVSNAKKGLRPLGICLSTYVSLRMRFLIIHIVNKKKCQNPINSSNREAMSSKFVILLVFQK